MADEISETKTRYERLDPNVVKVFRLAELANKDNEDCHLGELLKFSEDTAMTILMALDCEDNLPPLTEADLLAFVDVQEPDISASTADIRASVVKKFTAAVANLDGSAIQDIYHSAAISPPTKNLIAKISLILKRSMTKHKLHIKLHEMAKERAKTSIPVSPTPVPTHPKTESISSDPARQSAGYTDAIARGMYISDETIRSILADPSVAELVELLQAEPSSPKEAEQRLLRLQELFSSPATSIDSPIYVLRYLSVTFATDPQKTKAIQGSADDKAPLRKSFFRQIALLNAAHLTMLEVTLGTGDMGEFLNDKAQDSILSLIKGLDFNKALDKLYLFTDNPVAFELGAKATLTQEMRIRALSRLLKAFYAIFGDLIGDNCWESVLELREQVAIIDASFKVYPGGHKALWSVMTTIVHDWMAHLRRHLINKSSKAGPPLPLPTHMTAVMSETVDKEITSVHFASLRKLKYAVKAQINVSKARSMSDLDYHIAAHLGQPAPSSYHPEQRRGRQPADKKASRHTRPERRRGRSRSPRRSPDRRDRHK